MTSGINGSLGGDDPDIEVSRSPEASSSGGAEASSDGGHEGADHTATTDPGGSVDAVVGTAVTVDSSSSCRVEGKLSSGLARPRRSKGRSKAVRACGVTGKGQGPEVPFEALHAASPSAVVEVGGVEVRTLLDTGAESSLISRRFFERYLQGNFDVRDPEKGIKLVVANNTVLPFDGVVFLPVKFSADLVIECPFFISADLLEGQKYDVTLGWNVLKRLSEWQGPGDPQRQEDWREPLQFLRSVLSSQSRGSGESRGVGPVKVRLGRHPYTIPPRSIRVLNCNLRSRPEDLKGKLVLVEPAHKSLECPVFVNEMCVDTDGRTVKVVVSNAGSTPFTLAAFRELATVSPITEAVSLRTEESSDGLVVGVVEPDVSALESGVGSLVASPAGNEPPSPPEVSGDSLGDDEVQRGERLVVTTSDGVEHALPPGLVLNREGVLQDAKNFDAAVYLIKEFDSVFIKDEFDVGKCDVAPMRIRLVDDEPVSLPYRRIPPQHLQEVRDMLQKFLEQKIIRRSSSPYAAPVVLAKKTNGKLRFCVDYRKLNEKTIADQFPLPRVEEMLEALRGARIFSSVDMAHSFFQLALDEESIEKTAFRVPMGLFEFLRVPMGLKGSPAMMQRVIERCLGARNLLDLLLFLDDILGYTKIFEDHLDVLRYIFTQLGKFGLKLKGEKCHLFKSSVAFLGHVVSGDGIQTDPSKIEVIRDWPLPRTVRELRSFIGLAAYYKRFVRGFANIAAPLYGLLTEEGQKNFPNLPEDAVAAFHKLKGALIEAPVLAYPDFGREFLLETDACATGLGACLMQADADGKAHPVAYASRTLRPAERKYVDQSSFKMELLALKWAIADKFREYLSFSKFTVWTDNNPLVHLRSAKLGATQQRMVAALAPFDFEVKYRPGKTNQCADALSRLAPADWATATNTPAELRRVACVQSEPKAEIQVGSVVAGEVEGKCIWPGWTTEELAGAQRADPELKHVVQWVERGEFPNTRTLPSELKAWTRELKRFTFHDGVLCRKVNDPAMGPIFQLLAPGVIRLELLKAAHQWWGHPGTSRAFSFLRLRAFWPGMFRDIEKEVKSCDHCLHAKAPPRKQTPPQEHVVANRPLEILAVDMLKLDKGKGGFESVLVATDVYSKFSIAVPCRDEKATTVARALRDHWLSRYGMPLVLHSDQGRNFESGLIAELCALYGIKKTRTTSYHPQGNPVERFNRTLIAMLKSLPQSSRRRWPELLPHITHIYNTTPHSATRVAPYVLLFGREPHTPLDLLLRNTARPWSQQFVQEQSELLKICSKAAHESQERQNMRNKQYADTKASGDQIAEGTVVLLKRTHHDGRHKLENFHQDEKYVVVTRDGNTYIICPLSGNKPAQRVNRDKLYPVPGQPKMASHPVAENEKLGESADSEPSSSDEIVQFERLDRDAAVQQRLDRDDSNVAIGSDGGDSDRSEDPTRQAAEPDLSGEGTAQVGVAGILDPLSTGQSQADQAPEEQLELDQVTEQPQQPHDLVDQVLVAEPAQNPEAQPLPQPQGQGDQAQLEREEVTILPLVREVGEPSRVRAQGDAEEATGELDQVDSSTERPLTPQPTGSYMVETPWGPRRRSARPNRGLNPNPFNAPRPAFPTLNRSHKNVFRSAFSRGVQIVRDWSQRYTT